MCPGHVPDYYLPDSSCIMIAVLTYNRPHRKTFDLINKLIYRGYRPEILATPWIERKQHTPLIAHRPNGNNMTTEFLARTYDLTYTEIADYSCLKDYDYILIGGAGLLPDDVVKNNTIINAHPGYLPNVRGLDALKWAIYEGQPIGVTTHVVNSEVDSGRLIERNLVPLNKYDTFYSIAMKQYELEIEMLSRAVEQLHQHSEKIHNQHYQPHRRMPRLKEAELYERLQNYLKNY